MCFFLISTKYLTIPLSLWPPLPAFLVGTIYPVAFVWTSFQFSVDFSLPASVKKPIIHEFVSTYRTQQQLYIDFMNFLLIAKVAPKDYHVYSVIYLFIQIF